MLARAKLTHIVALGFFIRLVVCRVAWDRVPPTADGKFYHVVAQRIAEGNGYTWAWPDGAVTFAAHYPVGYPAMMAPLYFLFGPVPGVVMILNALLGSSAVWAVHGLAEDLSRQVKRDGHTESAEFSRLASNICALLLLLSPSLLAYTPALMTEGAVGSFLLLGARACVALHGSMATRPRAGWIALLVMSLVAATYLRPQSILLAPVLGFLSSNRGLMKRTLLALGLLVATLLCVAPWTARNCARMDSCVFVSANGGWNLLIGTFVEGQGAWVGLDGERVPAECREVFEEVAKDRCFGEAGKRKILKDLGRWAQLIPAKLRATFDHSAASTAHLLEAGALSEPFAEKLRAIEYLSQRLVFLLVLFGSWALSVGEAPNMRLSKRSIGAVLLGLGALGFVGVSAVLGWVCVLGLQMMGWRRLSSPAAGLFVFNLLATMVVHAVFFGAGRYFYPVLLLAFPLCAPGIVYICRAFPGTADRLKTST